MSSARFLDYEVALLLAKYGRAALLDALGKKLHLTPEQLDSILRAPINEKPASRSRKKSSPVDLVAELAHGHPEKAHLLRSLYGRFQNRTFLPEMRDVRRFFDQRARSLGASKSRAETLPRLLRLLAELDKSELDALCQAQPESAYSSLGIISDEILRRDK